MTKNGTFVHQTKEKFVFIFKNCPDFVCVKINSLETVDPNSLEINERRNVERPMINIQKTIEISNVLYNILGICYARGSDNHKYCEVKFGTQIYTYDDTKVGGWMTLIDGFPESSDQMEVVILAKCNEMNRETKV